MRRAVAAAIAAGLWLTSAACTAEPAANPPSTAPTATDPSTTTTSGTPTTSGPATTSPGEVKAPVMPALARENSRAGAKAFVRYYIATLNYSIHARSGDLLRGASTPGCRACNSVASLASGLEKKGGYQEGGDWTPTNIYFIPAQKPSEPIVDVTISVSHGELRLTKDDPVQQIPRETIHNEFHLRRLGNAWRMTKLVTS